MTAEHRTLKLAGVALLALSVLSALGIWKRRLFQATRERKLDERLDESFPCSDPVAKY